MSSLPPLRSQRAAAPKNTRTPNKQPDSLHLPAISHWSSPYHHDRLPPLSYSPMRDSSPPLSPHSVAGRHSYAYIRGSSPRYSPGGYHYAADLTWHYGYQDPEGGKYALPHFRSVFGDDAFDARRHPHHIPSEFDASESSEDAESSPPSDPLDRLPRPTASASTSIFDSEEEQEEDEGEGLSFRESGLRATFFRTSAERGQWRADPILPYQQSLLLQMRKSEPVPSTSRPPKENSTSLGAIQRRISEPALNTSKEEFLPADPSDPKVSCDPPSTSVDSAIAGGCVSAMEGSSDQEQPPLSTAQSPSSPTVDTRPALPPSSPLPALTPEVSHVPLPESESEATEPPASSEPSDEPSDTSDVLEAGEKVADDVVIEADVEMGVVTSAEDLAMESETRAESPLPPSSPFPPSSPVLEAVSETPALEPEVHVDLEQELRLEESPEENDNHAEITPAPKIENETVEPVLDQVLVGEADPESEARAQTPEPSLRSMSPLSFAPSSPVAPSSPLSVISSVDDEEFSLNESSSSGADELPVVSAAAGDDKKASLVEEKENTPVPVPASTSRPGGSKAKVQKVQTSASVALAPAVKEKEKAKPKSVKRKSEDGEEQVGKKRKVVAADLEKEKEKEKETVKGKGKAKETEKEPVKKSRKSKAKAKESVEEPVEEADVSSSSSPSTSTKAESKSKRAREEDAEDSKTTSDPKPKPKKRKSASSGTSHTLVAISPLSETELELQGLLIESLALSRASSMTISVLYKTVVQARPAMKEEKSLKEWMGVFERVLQAGWEGGAGMFGKVESSGKDDSEKPLEARWFYVPEQDADQERATLLRSMMPRPGKRSETKKYKQYYWRPLDKISRWDPEDDL